jgi:hypothetical protein
VAGQLNLRPSGYERTIAAHLVKETFHLGVEHGDDGDGIVGCQVGSDRNRPLGAFEQFGYSGPTVLCERTANTQ